MKKTHCSIRLMLDVEASKCEQILRSLPEWFGIEEAINEYRRDIEATETYVAEISGEIIGFMALNQHNAFSAEIHVMAISRAHHRLGLGRAMVNYAEQLLKARSIEYFEVKTLGPSRPNEHYERTRGFYFALGFRPLEENNLWGEVNPCLIMVKRL
ncbi:MAG: GNAT family N-acetyltransferase [Planctomycetes bacterium]|nr:GNAT family N-acetyltransferase [Planctomycetota bacterium]